VELSDLNLALRIGDKSLTLDDLLLEVGDLGQDTSTAGEPFSVAPHRRFFLDLGGRLITDPLDFLVGLAVAITVVKIADYVGER